MSNRDLFKQAIADAKAIREAAIANAKAALEESITPHVKEMLAEKLKAMEEMEEEVEMQGNQAVAEEEGMEETYEETMEEAKEEEAGEEAGEESEEGDEASEEEAEGDSEESEDEAEDMEVKDMDVEDLKELIRDILAQEMGEEMPGEEEMEVPGEEGAEDMVPGEAQPEDEIDLEELMAELATLENKEVVSEEEVAKEEVVAEFRADDAYFAKQLADLEAAHKAGKIGDSQYEHEKDILNRYMQETVSEEEITEMTGAEFTAMLPQVIAGITAMVGGSAGFAIWQEKAMAGKLGAAQQKLAKSLAAMGSTASSVTQQQSQQNEELAEALETIETLRNDLNETNLLNAKLLYVNKVFKANTLSETQKANVIAAFDKAETVKEVKLVFETVSENITSTGKKEVVKEAKGFASAAVGTSTKPEVITEANEVVKRMQKLAGIIK